MSPVAFVITSLIVLADEAHKDDVDFRTFRHQLFHSSLGAILQPMHPFMTKPMSPNVQMATFVMSYMG